MILKIFDLKVEKKTQKYRIRLAEKMFKFSIFRRFCEGRIGKPTKKKITYLI